MSASRVQALPTAPAASITVEASERSRTALLVCGILSSLVYAANNVICAIVWKGYSSFSQVISELSAIGAPSRSTWVPLGIAYAALLVAFGVGVWQSAGGRHGLRITAALLIGIGAVPYWPPMHMRGNVATLTDTLHIVFGGMTLLSSSSPSGSAPRRSEGGSASIQSRPLSCSSCQAP
jgi:hypothetical protein